MKRHDILNKINKIALFLCLISVLTIVKKAQTHQPEQHAELHK